MIMQAPQLIPSHFYNIGPGVHSLPGSYAHPLIQSTDPSRCTILYKPRYSEKPADSHTEYNEYMTKWTDPIQYDPAIRTFDWSVADESDLGLWKIKIKTLFFEIAFFDKVNKEWDTELLVRQCLNPTITMDPSATSTF